MDYDEQVKGQKREKMKPVFIWIPAIATFLTAVVTFLLKISEKTTNGFTTWGWVFGIIVIAAVITFGISIIIYLLTSMKDMKEQERQFNSREKCDTMLRAEIKHRTGYNLSDFSETGDSVEGVGWFGMGKNKEDQDLIYYHLYRIHKGMRQRYLLGVMNTQVGLEDHVIITQSPLNFRDLQRLILDTCNRLCRNPERMVRQERVYKDEVSGREEKEVTESPFDAPENEDFQQKGEP